MAVPLFIVLFPETSIGGSASFAGERRVDWTNNNT
jgi:hypothetical protein